METRITFNAECPWPETLKDAEHLQCKQSDQISRYTAGEVALRHAVILTHFRDHGATKLTQTRFDRSAVHNHMPSRRPKKLTAWLRIPSTRPMKLTAWLRVPSEFSVAICTVHSPLGGHSYPWTRRRPTWLTRSKEELNKNPTVAVMSRHPIFSAVRPVPYLPDRASAKCIDKMTDHLHGWAGRGWGGETRLCFSDWGFRADTSRRQAPIIGVPHSWIWYMMIQVFQNDCLCLTLERAVSSSGVTFARCLSVAQAPLGHVVKARGRLLTKQDETS